MKSGAMRLILVFCFLSPLAVRGQSAWDQLRIGMTEVEAEAILGKPLLRSAGQDFAVWIYNHRAELVFYGPLIAWSAPREGTTPGRVVDVWQAPPVGEALAVTFLPKPVRYLPAAERRAPIVPAVWRSAFRYGR